MKVKEFKKLLENYNDEDEVIMSNDGEGNNYSPFCEIQEEMIYAPDNEYSGEVYHKKLTKELENCGFIEEDLYGGDDGINAIVLYPIN
jgi:hypothetical protein